MSAHEHPWRTTILGTTAGLLLAANLVGCGGGAESGLSTAAPSTRSADDLRSMPEWNEEDEGEAAPIEPGSYLIPRSAWSVADFTATFPQGWAAQYGHVYAKNQDKEDEFGFYAVVVDEIYTDSCATDDETTRAVGPGVEDLYAALREQAGGTELSEPVSTTLGGYPATRIDLTIPKHLDVASCRMAPYGLQIWFSEPADKYFVLLKDTTASLYVVDVDGQRQVFLTQTGDAASAADRAELQAVLDSIHIVGSSSTATDESTGAAPQWSGPVRADVGLPFVPRRHTRGWTDPLDRFTPAPTFYAYSSLTEDGEVTAWDFAPDRAWLPMDCSRGCREGE